MNKFDIDLSCECGQFSATIHQSKPATGNHLVCACDDCKSFLYWLKKDKSLFSEQGGVELYQCSPSNFKIAKGDEHLKCFRLSPNGLDRWYLDCCNTPLANCIGANKNFIGFSTKSFKFNSVMDERLKIGPISAICHTDIDDKKAEIPKYKKFPFSIGFKVLKLLLSGKFKSSLCENPLYKNTKAINDIKVIGLDERKEILQKM